MINTLLIHAGLLGEASTPSKILVNLVFSAMIFWLRLVFQSSSKSDHYRIGSDTQRRYEDATPSSQGRQIKDVRRSTDDCSKSYSMAQHLWFVPRQGVKKAILGHSVHAGR